MAQKSRGREIFRLTTLTFLFLTSGISLFVLANYLFFQDKFLYGSSIGGVSIFGLTGKEANELLAEQLVNYREQPIMLNVSGSPINVYAKDLGLSLNYKEEMSILYNIQHPKQNSIKSIIHTFTKHFKKYNKTLQASFDSDSFNQIIYTNFPDVPLLAEPTVKFKEGKFVTVPGVEGKRISKKNLGEIQNHFEQLSRNPISIELEETKPQIAVEDVQKVVDEANAIAQQKIVLIAGGVRITEKFVDHPEWFEFKLIDEEEIVANALFKQPVLFKFGTGMIAGESIGPSFNILLKEEEVEKFVTENLVNKLQGHAENMYLRLDENGKLKVEGTLRHGYSLDTQEAVELIVNNFTNNIYENSLPISQQSGKIIDETGLNLGITELIGIGESDFSHSDSNRENNVQVGLSRFQNVLIAPGETFNYANYIGSIDAAHGFKPGWVIKNRTQLALEYGGGICQTSTTLFRAAFYAGLPIVERHPHGYDVSYYRWPAPGLDASVYVPYASLKWKNDTNNYILIQQYVNLNTKRAYVWLYGTKDGRKVETSGPDIYGKYWASSSVEIPDESLAPGTRIMTHGAVAGLQTDWWRTVTYTNGEKVDYTVHSSYSAVPATYKVGP